MSHSSNQDGPETDLPGSADPTDTRAHGAERDEGGTFDDVTDLPLTASSMPRPGPRPSSTEPSILDAMGPLPRDAVRIPIEPGPDSRMTPEGPYPAQREEHATVSATPAGDPPPPKAPNTPPPPVRPQETPKAPEQMTQSGTGADKPQDPAKTQSPKAPRPDDAPVPDPVVLGQNLAQAAAQCQELLTDFIARNQKQFDNPSTDPFNLAGPFSQLLQQFMSDPWLIMRSQMELWQAQTALWQATMRRLMGETVDPVVQPARGDKRWRHPEWANNQIFDFMKQSYLLTTQWLQETVHDVEGMDPETKRRVEFYTKQMADALSPSNFVLTNPEVIEETVKSNGENLVRGLNNLLRDLDRGKGELWIQQTDLEHFVVGENVATAPGSVVYQNELMQLIQYNPSTEMVYERPLLIFPPWINKYYILDLREENSFIRWASAQGYTVFLVSWVNPDDSLSRTTFEDYLAKGVLPALKAVRDATGAPDVNAIGYCIGGTLLSAALAYFAARGERPINSATYFAAQADFSESGELNVFIDEAQIRSIEAQVDQDGGYLDGVKLANTFNLLRANDLIWSFVINNYLMGKDPTRFDLLFWNSDQTRLPRDMLIFYLREFYQKNRLAKGEMAMLGEALDLSKVDIPMYIQSSKDDHIAPAKSVFKSAKLFGGDVKFVMSGSGHIAGVINHPDAKKYQFWTNDTPADDLDTWFAGAVETPGSWWGDWDAWLSKLSGEKIPARHPGDGALDVIEPAPGSYVKVKSA